MVSWGKDSSCYRWNQRNRFISLSLAFIFSFTKRKLLFLYMASASLVLRETDGCLYIYRYTIVEESGAAVHTWSRNEVNLNKCLQEWATKGFRVIGSVCDLLSRPQWEELINKVSHQFNDKLNILVSLWFLWSLIKEKSVVPVSSLKMIIKQLIITFDFLFLLLI